MIKIKDTGFHFTFQNGWTASVQIGPGNYCENRMAPMGTKITQCGNAEIAAWDADGKWYNFGTDDVKGWVEAEEIAAFLQEIALK
jgi:hypothetical protein